MGRYWVRAAVRRWRRAVTIVLALVVMTLATTGALIGGDTLDRLFREDFAAEWGTVDVEGRSGENSVLADSLARLLSVEAGPTAVAAAPRLILAGVVAHHDLREPQALVLGLGPEEAGFPALERVGGIADPLRLRNGEVIVNSRLSKRINAGVGDEIELVVAVPEWEERIPDRERGRIHRATTARLTVVVAGVVADSGAADLHRTPNVLLPRDTLQGLTGLVPAQSTAVHLRAAADGRDAAEDLIDEITPLAQRVGVVFDPVKADALDIAEEEGGLFRSILLTLALLVVVAAVSATIELFTALGYERAGELALLRAAGLSRRAASRLLVAEGLVYAAVGVALGSLLAVPTGQLLARGIADHLSSINSGRGREQVALEPVLSGTALVSGALIVLLAAAWAARSSARRVLAADLDEVLRGDPRRAVGRPAGTARPVATLVAGAFLLGAAMTSSATGALAYLGITLVLVAAWLRARRRTSDLERLDQRAALIGLAWSLGGAALLGDFDEGVQAGFGVLTVAGLVAVTATGLLVTPRLRAAMRFVRSYVRRGPAQAALAVGGAYAEESRERSLVRMGTVGGALFMVAALTVLGSAQALEPAEQSGGFDVLATSVAGVDPADLREQPAVAAVVGMPHTPMAEDGYWVEDDDGNRASVPYPVRLVATGPDFAEVQRFGLVDALPEYDTAADAFADVLRDNDKAVVDRYALPEGAHVGDDVVLDMGPGPRRLKLVAVLDTFLLNSVFVGRTAFTDVASTRGDTLFLAAGADGAAPDDVARALEDAQRQNGLVADTVGEVRDDVVAVNRNFTDLFAVMLLLGLAVAVVSIAAGTTRAARERRAELAVLRALGLPRRGVVTALTAEPVLAATLGGVAGLAVGLLVLRLLFALGYSSLAFVLDVPRLALGLIATLLLLLVASLLAAAPAARRDPAEALTDLG